MAATAKTDIGVQVENIIGLAIVTIERQFGIAGLDHVLQSVESRRKTLLYEAEQERTQASK
jgi:hypothetical protein